MHVRRLEFNGFHNYDSAEIELPDEGIVVITGGNGAGKSTIMEAVSWGLWGKTLRGVTPGGEGVNTCRVRVETDSLTIERGRKKGVNSLRWGVRAEPLKKYTTAREAGSVLTNLIGSHALWKRARVFSSQDAAHFSQATDKERKTILEEILHLDIFEAAHAEVKKNIKTISAELSRRKIASVKYTERLTAAEDKLRIANESLTALDGDDWCIGEGLISELKKKIADCKLSLTELKTEILSLREEQFRLKEGVGKYTGIIATNRARIDMVSNDQCPTCEQKITETHKSKVIEESTNNVETFQSELSALELRITEILEESEECSETERITRRKMGNFEHSLRESGKNADIYNRWERLKKEATKTVEAENTNLNVNETKIAADGESLEEFAICETALGMRGIRANIIARALSGIEDCANQWLGFLCDGVKITLADQTLLTSGRTANAIALGIDGVGAGRGYKAASGGERRRIDVALMLGLSYVADAAYGQGGGTIFFDEVFDTLDETGILGVVEILEELAQTRAIIVITHNENLAKKIPATKRFDVVSGKISVT